ncbi:hypothetical protein LCI18_011260 [Fusarium solani-melongenae]|uniref:Uncharacterized protein n=1 Tax=Fusarium solani subsp. cucurbitae TaxID=2747967 RepID=A0ACD3ZGG5_FUSSC|nr:hypothetical protein LCI18_011260 [Fusarium solani-melongenae]
MVSSALSFLLGSLAIGAVTAKPVSTTTVSSCVPVATTVAPGDPTVTFITQPEERDDDKKPSTSLHIDFEDNSLDHWTINSDKSFSYNIEQLQTPYGDSHVFKIIEPTADGYAFVDYKEIFKLEESKRGYKIAFTARCSWIGKDGVTDWSPIEVILKHSGSRVFETKPSNGKDLGNGWARFEEELQNGDVTGDTKLRIRVKATGWSLHWYFDDIVVEKIE